ncbi:putative aminopeptidase W07G4.4 [Babylonia areolata]|uniref:putative aminopeptidase W07G4.4 n=1 Tax=Babylonia areolata TaxID=304850 RepID=UPI003FD4C0E7
MAASRVAQVTVSSDVRSEDYDGVVVVTDHITRLEGDPLLQPLLPALHCFAKINQNMEKEVSIIQTDAVPSGRLVYSPTGPLNRDFDDVRRFSEAAEKGIKRAVEAGCRKPLLVQPVDKSFEKSDYATLLGALHALYVPLEVWEACEERRRKVEVLGVMCGSLAMGTPTGLDVVMALETGRTVTRDIGGSDPERMAAPRVADYIRQTFKGTCVKVEVVEDRAEIEKEFPLMAAVNRAASVVKRHQARLVFLEYRADGPIDKTLFLVGKGITYDTGGADIKAGGVMAGMHRDKCGAAAVAGFFKVLAELKPSGLRVVGGLPFVRNSVGEESYVADEIITSRARKRVRVGNTDAEGRMVMADVLCKFKEMAAEAVNPELFTIATLTGHAVRAMGPNYSIIMDNGPARKLHTSYRLQEVGEVYGDPFEISTIRREDYEFHKGKSEYEDILQCNNQPSTATPRGHQSPSAFLIMTSGMDQHGVDSNQPYPYSHLDIAGSSGPFPGIPTAAPVVAMAACYVLPRLK